jgi:hypothetical protein
MKTARTDKDFKILFEKMGTEKTPEDFTSKAMRKIEAESSYALSKILPKDSYWFLLPYLIALILVTPFIVPTINWIINIDWSFVSFDISFLHEGFERFADSIAGIALTTQSILIALVFAVLLIIISIEIFTQSHRSVFD